MIIIMTMMMIIMIIIRILMIIIMIMIITIIMIIIIITMIIIIITMMIIIIVIIIIIITFITQGQYSQIQDLIIAEALRFKIYTSHASGHRVENLSRYFIFNDKRDGRRIS